jgi:predicted GNAT family acetyltransferase
MGLKKITTFRTMLMGVSAEFRGRGLDAIMVAEVIKAGRKAGYNRAELSWVLESNHAMNSIASKLGRAYRRYRIFEREL